MLCFDYPLVGGRHHIETFKRMVACGTMDVNVSIEVTHKNLARASLIVCVTTYISFILNRIFDELLVLLNISSSHLCFLFLMMKTWHLLFAMNLVLACCCCANLLMSVSSKVFHSISFFLLLSSSSSLRSSFVFPFSFGVLSFSILYWIYLNYVAQHHGGVFQLLLDSW